MNEQFIDRVINILIGNRLEELSRKYIFHAAGVARARGNNPHLTDGEKSSKAYHAQADRLRNAAGRKPEKQTPTPKTK